MGMHMRAVCVCVGGGAAQLGKDRARSHPDEASRLLDLLLGEQAFGWRGAGQGGRVLSASVHRRIPRRSPSITGAEWGRGAAGPEECGCGHAEPACNSSALLCSPGATGCR